MVIAYSIPQLYLSSLALFTCQYSLLHSYISCTLVTSQQPIIRPFFLITVCYWLTIQLSIMCKSNAIGLFKSLILHAYHTDLGGIHISEGSIYFRFWGVIKYMDGGGGTIWERGPNLSWQLTQSHSNMKNDHFYSVWLLELHNGCLSCIAVNMSTELSIMQFK